MTVNLSENPVLSTLDLEDPYWLADDSDRIELPGAKRAAASDPTKPNKVSRKQARTIIRGLVQNPDFAGLPADQAFDKARGPENANLRGGQHDIQIVQWVLANMRAANADLPLTASQQDLIATNLAALNGTEAHFEASVNAKIVALDPQFKNKFLMDFMNVTTQGELDRVMTMFRSFVGDPGANRARAARTVAESIANMDVSEETTEDEDGEESF